MDLFLPRLGFYERCQSDWWNGSMIALMIDCEKWRRLAVVSKAWHQEVELGEVGSNQSYHWWNLQILPLVLVAESSASLLAEWGILILPLFEFSCQMTLRLGLPFARPSWYRRNLVGSTLSIHHENDALRKRNQHNFRWEERRQIGEKNEKEWTTMVLVHDEDDEPKSLITSYSRDRGDAFWGTFWLGPARTKS